MSRSTVTRVFDRVYDLGVYSLYPYLLSSIYSPSMLSPKRTKFKKNHRGRIKGKAQRGHTLHFGQFALAAKEPGWVTARQIEAGRRSITRYTKRTGKLWIRIFPDKPITARPAETRMGAGKGAVDYWVAVVKPGRILYEVNGGTRNFSPFRLPCCKF